MALMTSTRRCERRAHLLCVCDVEGECLRHEMTSAQRRFSCKTRGRGYFADKISPQLVQNVLQYVHDTFIAKFSCVVQWKAFLSLLPIFHSLSLSNTSPKNYTRENCKHLFIESHIYSSKCSFLL